MSHTLLLRVPIDAIGTCKAWAKPGVGNTPGTVILHIPTPFEEVPALTLTSGLIKPGGAPAADAAAFQRLCGAIDATWVGLIARAAIASLRTTLDATPAQTRALLRARAALHAMLF